ncbi:Asp-tRNA(Asn)/Glu-tRNA(Gln) amidotransferase subunit GatA [Patescibacteria group bacterium]|nr:Asp-tRNA(Asn)/Glu-tRNA(Gln) amidotransferase subunit GatA [Patescibacteria group bacterium]
MIKQIRQGLLKGEFSAKEIAQKYLSQIEKSKLDAFISVCPDLALKKAKEADEIIASKKELSPLAGIPCAIKDNILVSGIRCTAGSRILEKYIAPYNATVIEKMSAVILGKTNLDEFGMGASTENSAFMTTKNPHDLTRVPGGSSGGSAAAVSAKECVFALGSDTGGSIRQPSSFSGVVGFKPSYGAVSRYGLIAFASSLEQIGPIAENVEDAEIVFKAIMGKDEKDSTSVSITEDRIGDFKIGIPKEYFVSGLDPEVEKTIKSAVKKIEDAGIKIEEISLPHTEYALACYYIIAPSEASANLARYDGIKYGLSEKAEDLLSGYLKTRASFGPEVKRRIMLGTYSLSSGYYDAYYLKAQTVRNLICQDFEKAFKKVDLILTPVSPTVAFKIGEKKDPLSMYLSDIFTVAVNLAGLPAISIPCKHSLPVGLQIIGKRFSDFKVLSSASFIEKMRI